MKHIKTFESFVNEAHLDFNIQKAIQLNGISFELDEERTEDDDDNRLEQAQVYVGQDRRNGVEWVIKVGEMRNGYYMEITEDESVVFTHEYPKNQKAYFDQDCMNSLGFLPDFE